MQIFIKTPIKTLLVAFPSTPTYSNLYEKITSQIPFNDFSLFLSGKQIFDNETIKNIKDSSTLYLNLPLKGGKGGFGAAMRNQANTRRKITNWDSSKDLQGRRIRNINNEKKLVDYLRKKKKEGQEIEDQIIDFKDMEQSIKQNIFDQKFNHQYIEKLKDAEENITSSVRLGLQALKRKRKDQEENKEDEDDDEEDDDSDDEYIQDDESDLENPQKKKKLNDNQNVEHEEVPMKKSKQNSGEKIAENYQYLNNNKQNKNDIKTEEVDKNDKKQQENENKTDENTEKKQSSEDVNKNEENKEQNDKNIQTKVEPKEKKDFEEINLQKIKKKQQLQSLDPDHIKHELERLGLKAGGTANEKVERLWSIKLDPANLFNPKLLAKKKK